MKRIIVGMLIVVMGLVFLGCKTSVEDTTKNSTKAITAFSLVSPAASGTVTESSHTISISVPATTDITALTPTVTHTGESISPASSTAQNFSNPVVYTVTAQDATTQTYTVTVYKSAALSVTSPEKKYYENIPTLSYTTSGDVLSTKVFINDVETVITNGSSISGISTGFNTVKISTTGKNGITVTNETTFFINNELTKENHNFSVNTISDLSTFGYVIPGDFSITNGTLSTSKTSSDFYCSIGSATGKKIVYAITVSSLCKVTDSYFELGIGGSSSGTDSTFGLQIIKSSTTGDYALFLKEWNSTVIGKEVGSLTGLRLEESLPIKCVFFISGTSSAAIILDANNNILKNISTNAYNPTIGLSNFTSVRIKIRPVDSSVNNIGITSIKLNY